MAVGGRHRTWRRQRRRRGSRQNPERTPKQGCLKLCWWSSDSDSSDPAWTSRSAAGVPSRPRQPVGPWILRRWRRSGGDPATGGATVWTVTSRVVPVTADDLRRADPIDLPADSEILRRYGTEDHVVPAVAELAAAITVDAPTTYDKVIALGNVDESESDLHEADRPSTAGVGRRPPAAVRNETGLLRADRECPGGDAPIAGHPGPDRGGLRPEFLRRSNRRVVVPRHRCPCLGRGLLPRCGLARLRPNCWRPAGG